MTALDALAASFSWVARSSAEAVIIVAIIMAMQALLRNRLKPRWRYALWLVLVARLFMPWAPESPVSVFNYLKVPESAHVSLVRVLQTESNASPAFVTSATPAQPQVLTTHPPVLTPMRVLGLLWLLGAALFAAHVVVENTRLWRKIRKDPPLEDRAALQALKECREVLSVRKPPLLVASDAVSSPALFGFWRPRLLVPHSLVGNGNSNALRYIFLHELAHLKRHDVIVNWLTTALQAIHWFNPFLWYAFYRMRMDREPACDALALSCLQPEESQEYGQTILDLLDHFYTVRRVPGMAAILEDKSQIRERIMQISLFTRHSYRWSALACVVLALVGSLVLTNANTVRAAADNTVKATGSPVADDPAFKKVYSLADGQALKFIPPPFIPERATVLHARYPRVTSPQPPYCLFKDDNGSLTILNCILPRTSTQPSPPLPLHLLVDWLFPGAFGTFLFSDELAQAPIPPGDWVVDAKAEASPILKELASILNLPIEQKQMERDVLEISGQLKRGRRTFRLLPCPYAIPTFVRDSTHLDDVLGSCLGMTVINNASGTSKGLHVEGYELASPAVITPEFRERLLNDLARQTGLTFRIQRATLPVWVISNPAGDPEPARVTLPVTQGEVSSTATPPDASSDVETCFYELQHLAEEDYPTIEQYIDQLPKSPKRALRFVPERKELVLTDMPANLARFEEYLAETDVTAKSYSAELKVIVVKSKEAASVLHRYGLAESQQQKPWFTIEQDSVEKLMHDLDELRSMELLAAPRITFRVGPQSWKNHRPNAVLKKLEEVPPYLVPDLEAYSSSYAKWAQEHSPASGVIAGLETEAFADPSGIVVQRPHGILTGYKAMPIADSEDLDVDFYSNMTCLNRGGIHLDFWNPRPIPTIDEAPVQQRIRCTPDGTSAIVMISEAIERHYLQVLILTLTKVEETGQMFYEADK